MPKDDVWVHTSCDMCLGACGMLAHRVDGVVVEVKGDPDCPNSRGKLCARGHAVIMNLYDPNRMKAPLKRTNPEKGLGVDPKWVAISWDEAMNILVEKLTKVRKEDPRKLVTSTFDTDFSRQLAVPWCGAFGTPNAWTVYFCGPYLHASMYITNGTFHCDFDADYCNYLLLVGNQAGFGMGLNPNITAQKVAVARKRGMKVVAIDPVCNHAASKADDWLPIRPGTDAALIWSMISVLLNELGIYDREFIKRYTNGPYLVKPDGFYMRQDGKALVWDAADGKARPFDAEVKDYAIEGSYTVAGVECKPAFQMLKEHVKKYTPEMAAEITTIPAATIRRIAQEFGTAASIGSTITIDGKELPYRPVSANLYRGAGAHKHGIAVALASQILNQIVGAFYSVGSHRGLNAIGPNWSWSPGKTENEGLVTPAPLDARAKNYYATEVTPPTTLPLDGLYPLTTTRASNCILTAIDPGKYHLPYKPEVLINCRRNLFLDGLDYSLTAKAIKAYSYVVCFSTHLDETAEFADLVLPEQTLMEKFQLFPNQLVWSETGQTGYWYYGVRQPVVPPIGEARNWWDVMLELADRMGFLSDVYKFFNLELKEPYKLDISRKYTREEIADRKVKSEFGDKMGVDWFKENGYFSFKRKVDEQYPLPWLKVRFPIYFENYLDAKERLIKVTKEIGLKDWDVSSYKALPEWEPCASYNRPDGFDLIAVNFRVPTHSQSFTAQNAWLAEVAELNPYAKKIIINTETAKRKGIKDKDKVCVESAVTKMIGEAKVTECIHPEAVGISGHFGGFAKGRPVAVGSKGCNINGLYSFEADPVTTGLDSCVKVKVYKYNLFSPPQRTLNRAKGDLDVCCQRL